MNCNRAQARVNALIQFGQHTTCDVNTTCNGEETNPMCPSGRIMTVHASYTHEIQP